MSRNFLTALYNILENLHFSMYEDAVHEVLDFVLALFLVFRHFFNLWALSFFSLTISYLKHSGC